MGDHHHSTSITRDHAICNIGNTKYFESQNDDHSGAVLKSFLDLDGRGFYYTGVDVCLFLTVLRRLSKNV